MKKGKKGFNLIITHSYSIDLMLGHKELMKTGLMHKNRGFHPTKPEICNFNIIPLLVGIFTWHKTHKDNLINQGICCLVKALLQTPNKPFHTFNSSSGVVGLINKSAPELCDTTVCVRRLRTVVQPAGLLQARTKGHSQSRD